MITGSLEGTSMSRFMIGAVGIPGLLLALCASNLYSAEQTSPLLKKTNHPVDAAVRDNALNLLCDLLSDEKNLSKLLIIKHASPELKLLVKSISNSAANSLKELETTLGIDPAKRATNLDLPAGETATRQAISKTKEHELLHSSGSELEFELLLTQVEALNYGAHLARVISENESDPGRARLVASVSDQLQQLLAQVTSRLRTIR
jgi:hypothetical protein